MNDIVINPQDGSTITRGNSWLYLRVVQKEGTFEEKVHYRPYTLDDINYLKSIKLGLCGDKTQHETRIWNSTFIRFGWLDQGLSSLEWVPISKAANDYVNRTISKTNRTKLNHVCRLLFISIKDIKND